MGLIIAESFKRFFELNRSKSKIANILLEDNYTTIEFGNYIARRGDMISFLPYGKEHQVNPDTGDWKRENRQTAKAGKLARKLIDEQYIEALELKDTDYELFSNLIKADKINDEDCAVKFIKVKGENIRYRYHEENHSERYSLGSLADSCMRYNNAQSWLDIYVDNPKQVSLLVMVDCDDKTVGRAIVWKTTNGDVFMDRVYATDAHQKMFENYAEDKGWMYKSQHNNDQDTRIMKNGESDYKTIVVQLENWNPDYYPYMDTLSYLSNNGKISNYNDYNDRELRETDGRVTNQEDDHEGEVWDEYNDEWINENNATYISGYGHVRDEDARYDDYRDDYILERDSQRLENGKWCHEDDAVETEDGYYHKDDLDDFEYINGKYYNRENDCVLDKLTHEYILENESVELYEGGRTHEDNREIVKLDSYYGSEVYAKSKDLFECPYSDTWFLIDDSSLLYSGKRVSDLNRDMYLEDHPEEIIIANNQLIMEIDG
jgi:hypothetical protein